MISEIFIFISCKNKSTNKIQSFSEQIQEVDSSESAKEIMSDSPEEKTTAQEQSQDSDKEGTESFRWIPNDTLVVKEKVKLRDSSSLSGNLIEVLDEGTEVSFIEVGKETEHSEDYICPWIKVSHDGKEGWCFGAYLCNPRADEYFFNLLDGEEFGFSYSIGYFSRCGDTLVARYGDVEYNNYFEDLNVVMIDGECYAQRPRIWDESHDYLPYCFRPSEKFFSTTCEYKYSLGEYYGAGKVKDGDEFFINNVTAKKCNMTVEFLKTDFWYESPLSTEPYSENKVYWDGVVHSSYRKIPNCKYGIKYMRHRAVGSCNYNGEAWFLIFSGTMTDKLVWVRASSVREVTQKEKDESQRYDGLSYEERQQKEIEDEKKVLAEMEKIGAVPFSEKDEERMSNARGYELLVNIAYDLEW